MKQNISTHEIAERIKQLREKNNLTQQDLAYKSGVDLKIIEGIESGEVDLGLQPVTIGLDITQALGTTVGELFDRTLIQ